MIASQLRLTAPLPPCLQQQQSAPPPPLAAPRGGRRRLLALAPALVWVSELPGEQFELRWATICPTGSRDVPL